MNSFQKKRAEKLEQILSERGIDYDDGIIDELAEYLDKEISSAFGRGVRHTKKDSEKIQR